MRLVHDFGQKLGFFPYFQYWQNIPGKCVWEYSRKKKALPGYRNNKSKSRKFWIFLKWFVHDFRQKLALFPYFLYRQKSSAKCVWKYSRSKKGFPEYKKNKLKKWKILDFFNGVSPWCWLKVCNFSIFWIQAK